jgi:hypothetical protein
MCDADILAKVRISDAPEILRLHELEPVIHGAMARARDLGFSPVSLRWPNGLFALVFCESGNPWPRPEIILEAYRQGINNSKTFPDGDISCKH